MISYRYPYDIHIYIISIFISVKYSVSVRYHISLTENNIFISKEITFITDLRITGTVRLF